MLRDCATPAYVFVTATPLPLQAAFDGGRLTSDGGLPRLAEADTALGLCAVDQPATSGEKKALQ